MIKKLLLALGLAAALSISANGQNNRPPLPIEYRVPSDGSGLWLIDKKNEVTFQGLTGWSTITFSLPVQEELPAGSYVQFCVCLENKGAKAPQDYIVEINEGDAWRTEAGCTFETVDSKVKHPSTFLHIFKLQKAVSDTLFVRCRVNSPLTTGGERLQRTEPENEVALKCRGYVGARLTSLGNTEPAEEKNLLLIGNSFTYYFGEPIILQEIAFSQGLRLNITASLKGGQSFRQHCGLRMTSLSIKKSVYDYAIIQGQSQEPARWAADRKTNADVKAAFGELCDKIRLCSPDCKIYIEKTWSYPGADNGGFATEDKFFNLLEKGSKKLARGAKTSRTLVGDAFRMARRECPSIDILDKDSKHQALAGSYLKACVTYLTFSGKPFEGEVPSCCLPDEEAAALRDIAEYIVLR